MTSHERVEPRHANQQPKDKLTESIKAAVLTALLCIPIILFHAESDNNGILYLIWRPWMVVAFAAIAFVGRFAVLSYAAFRRQAARRSSSLSRTRKKPSPHICR